MVVDVVIGDVWVYFYDVVDEFVVDGEVGFDCVLVLFVLFVDV